MPKRADPTTPEAPAPSPPMSDEAIERRTGRSWQAWFERLTAWGAADRSHTEIAAWLAAAHDVDGWSAQAITVAFERAHGGRGLGQRADGFEVSASKTVAIAVAKLYRAFMDDVLRARWLPGTELRLRTASAPKSARFDWGEGRSRVMATFTDKGPSKSSITVTHVRLPDADEATRTKAFWRERLVVLAALIEAADR